MTFYEDMPHDVKLYSELLRIVEDLKRPESLYENEEFVLLDGTQKSFIFNQGVKDMT